MTEAVVITGGGNSVGREMAERFLARGDRVHICDVEADYRAATLAANPGMSGSHTDVGDASAVARLFEDARRHIGEPTVLVNNVGIGGPRAAMEDVAIDEWDRTIRVNLSGMFYCIREAVPAMKRGRHGVIVNFSTGSTRTRLPMRAPYVASKAGVEGLTLNAARELGPHNVRCNAILPGMINNERMRGIIKRNADAAGKTEKAIEDEYLQFISMRTKIEPSEIADMVLFLASPGARKVTGELISVSGNVEWEI
jgi:NAD(P)-dependent dehydrogenase (short-subunit alcohol dehydrogenase family)